MQPDGRVTSPLRDSKAAAVGSGNSFFDNRITDNRVVSLIVVVPVMESEDRIAPASEMRPVTGLPVAGGQSIPIAFGPTPLFSPVSVFRSGQSVDFHTRFVTTLNNEKTANACPKIVWIGRSKQDLVFRNAECLLILVRSAYTYIVLRLSLSVFVPIVFR